MKRRYILHSVLSPERFVCYCKLKPGTLFKWSEISPHYVVGKHGIVSPHDGPVPSRRVPARPATRVLGELKSIGEEPELVGELSCLVPRNGDSSHVAGGECPSEDLLSVLWSQCQASMSQTGQ